MRKLSKNLEKELLKIKWKEVTINGKGTQYEVSSTGLVFSHKINRTLIPCLDSDNYPQVSIYLDGKHYCKKIHRLVAEAFIPNPNNLPQINHIDGNKLNNNYTNLEWVTCQENIDHAYKMGLRSNKNASSGAYHKYDETVIRKICELLEEGKLHQTEIAKICKVPKELISTVKCGKNWKHISDKYNLPSADVQGEKHHNAKFTNAQVDEACRMLEEDKYSYKDIIDKTGLTKAAIASIKRKRTWNSISDKYNIPSTKTYRGEKHYNSKFTSNQIHEVCKLLKENKLTHVQIQNLTNVNEKVISSIAHKKCWKDISDLYEI